MTFNPKDRVAYVPYHAHGDINHPDVEYGIVSSVGAENVFVKFDKQVHRLGWDQTTAQSCYPNTLQKIS